MKGKHLLAAGSVRDMAKALSATALAAVVCVAGGLGGQAMAQPAFQAPVRHATEARPNDIVAGDFDGDGWMDVTLSHLATSGAGTAITFFGQPGGTFGDLAFSTIGTWARGLAPGDLNGDGLLDWAATCDGRTYLGYNLGARSFQSSSWIPGGNQHGIVVADLNGDARQDIAGTYIDTSAGKRQAVVNYGQAGGGFSSPFAYTVGIAPDGIVAADLNADGLADLATANQTTVSVLRANAGGGFAPHVDYPKGRSGWGTGLAAADLNRDGHLDLVGLNSDDASLSVLYGRGNGTFTGATVYATTPDPREIVCADFDRDGWIDIAVSAGNQLDIYSGATGGFVRRPGIPLSAPAGLAAADLNGDGWIDLAATEYADARFAVLFNSLPEPFTLSLLALGGLALMRRRHA